VGENTPNATVSYYTKGSLIALCLDLTLRGEGHGSLDDVMRTLWQRCQGGPMREADVRRALKRVGRRDFDTELDAWVHGTQELPAEKLLQAAGVKSTHEPAPLAQHLGLRVSEGASGVTIKAVLRGGAGEAAGLAAGDEWVGIELAAPRRGEPAEAWRIHKLDEVAWLRGERARLTALVSRDRRLLRCPLEWPPQAKALRLAVGDANRLTPWLKGSD
jgi:predicted metalloprotease with PDZ domain